MIIEGGQVRQLRNGYFFHLYSDLPMRAAKRWKHGADGNSGCRRMIRADPSHPLHPCSIRPTPKPLAGHTQSHNAISRKKKAKGEKEKIEVAKRRKSSASLTLSPFRPFLSPVIIKG